MRRPFEMLVFVPVVLLLAGCSLLSRPSPTSAPEARRWEAPPVVAQLSYSGGLMPLEYAWSQLPTFVLYADGRVLVSRQSNVEPYPRWLLQGRLEPAQVCAFLAAVEADGFFDYNPDDYHPPDVLDAGSAQISVNAWRMRSISAYALDVEGAKVPPALLATYKRMAQYEPPDAALYEPEHVALRVTLQPQAQPAPEWTVASVSLGALSRPVVVLDGAQAARVYAFFAGRVVALFNENGKTYSVAMRPLLPLEQVAADTSSAGGARMPDTPRVTLDCSGALPTPLVVTPAAITPWPARP